MTIPISKNFIAFLIITTLAGGCNLFPFTPKTVYNIEITTDQAVYTLPLSEEDPDAIYYTVVNLSDVSVYYWSPGPFVTLEKKQNDEWTNLGTWYGWIGIGPFIREFEPGDTLVPIELPLEHEKIEEPGYYRFLLDFHADTDSQSLLPLYQRVSNSFEIRKYD